MLAADQTIIDPHHSVAQVAHIINDLIGQLELVHCAYQLVQLEGVEAVVEHGVDWVVWLELVMVLPMKTLVVQLGLVMVLPLKTLVVQLGLVMVLPLNTLVVQLGHAFFWVVHDLFYVDND